MSKPVDQPSFWSERLEVAKKDGVLHHSVYLTTSFREIDAAHKSIISYEGVGGKVLDAGCGYGRHADFFHDQGYAGIDISPAFIELAQKVHTGKKFIVGDIAALPFPDKSFDWAVCVSVRQMIIGNLGEEKWKAYQKELKRVARMLLVLEYSEPTEYWVL